MTLVSTHILGTTVGFDSLGQGWQKRQQYSGSRAQYRQLSGFERLRCCSLPEYSCATWLQPSLLCVQPGQPTVGLTSPRFKAGLPGVLLTRAFLLTHAKTLVGLGFGLVF